MINLGIGPVEGGIAYPEHLNDHLDEARSLYVVFFRTAFAHSTSAATPEHVSRGQPAPAHSVLVHAASIDTTCLHTACIVHAEPVDAESIHPVFVHVAPVVRGVPDHTTQLYCLSLSRSRWFCRSCMCCSHLRHRRSRSSSRRCLCSSSSRSRRSLSRCSSSHRA